MKIVSDFGDQCLQAPNSSVSWLFKIIIHVIIQDWFQVIDLFQWKLNCSVL